MHLFNKVLLIFLFLFISNVVVLAVPQINSEAAYLINADNNQVLYEKNGDKIMYPASTTKIMTTLVALKYGNLNSIVTVNPDAVGIEGTSLNLKVGDQLTLQDLLHGMMAVSGNDAAQAVAEHVGEKSPQKFIDLMNKEAIALGANHTHFSNPHGLPAPDNYSTAHDLAVITAYAYHQPGFVDYVSHKYQTIHFINRNTNEQEESINKLLDTYPGCNGVKSGTTREAGECLVAAAKQNGIQLIAVVLNSSNRWQDATKLLDYGFQQTSLQQAASNVNKPGDQDQLTSSTLEPTKEKSDTTPDTVNTDNQEKSSDETTKECRPNNPALESERLLEFGVCAGGSYNAAYLFQTEIFNSTSYIGPTVNYHSHKESKISAGVRLAWPVSDSDNLLEFSAYGDHSVDGAYLFQTDIFNGSGYIGPVVKYDPDKKNRFTVGVRLTLLI